MDGSCLHMSLMRIMLFSSMYSHEKCIHMMARYINFAFVCLMGENKITFLWSSIQKYITHMEYLEKSCMLPCQTRVIKSSPSRTNSYLKYYRWCRIALYSICFIICFTHILTYIMRYVNVWTYCIALIWVKYRCMFLLNVNM